MLAEEMSSPHFPLPDYSRPPVTEVIFAASLRPLPLSIVDLARFGWERLGDDFPDRQDQAPLQLQIESFDGTVQNLAPTLALLAGAPPVRLWFKSSDRTRLVQVQRDLLAYNWQRAGDEDAYPRYETIENRFFETWDDFSGFVNDNGHGAVEAIQCELSYINHITPNGMWQRHGELSKVLRIADNAGSFLPEPEDGQMVFRYRIPHEGRDVGRLYVHVLPALSSADRSPVIQLNMVARGAPLGPGRSGVVDFFRLAHVWIVNGFAAVTTDEAQALLWQRVTR